LLSGWDDKTDLKFSRQILLTVPNHQDRVGLLTQTQNNQMFYYMMIWLVSLDSCLTVNASGVKLQTSGLSPN
jgi:hypothetical protein